MEMKKEVAAEDDDGLGRVENWGRERMRKEREIRWVS
jgi:hypothetical protein